MLYKNTDKKLHNACLGCLALRLQANKSESKYIQALDAAAVACGRVTNSDEINITRAAGDK
jgi:hypothetical protein